MIFTKQELEFLTLFQLCADPKDVIGRNFQIKKIKKDTIRFFQTNNNAIIYKDVNAVDVEDFCCNYPTDKIVQLVKSCSENEKITFKKSSIKMGNRSEYKFEQINYDVSSDEKMVENESIDFKNTIHLVDLEKINVIKSYIGNDSGFDAVSLTNNYFVATNKTDADGFIKTSNNYDKRLFLSKLMVGIISSFKIKELDLYTDDKKYVFIHNDTCIIIPLGDYKIPDYFIEKYKKFYKFDDKLKVNKSELLIALNRINIFSKDNIHTRIFLTFEDNKIKIESKDKNYAIEIIKADIDKNLIGHYFITSASHLINSIANINSDIVTFQIKPDKNEVAFSIWQENEERFFIHRTLQDLEKTEDK
jgi:hypothetical protein